MSTSQPKLQSGTQPQNKKRKSDNVSVSFLNNQVLLGRWEGTGNNQRDIRTKSCSPAQVLWDMLCRKECAGLGVGAGVKTPHTEFR